MFITRHSATIYFQLFYQFNGTGHKFWWSKHGFIAGGNECQLIRLQVIARRCQSRIETNVRCGAMRRDATSDMQRGEGVTVTLIALAVIFKTIS